MNGLDKQLLATSNSRVDSPAAFQLTPESPESAGYPFLASGTEKPSIRTVRPLSQHPQQSDVPF